MLPWLRRPWNAQAGFGQGGMRFRRSVRGLAGDFDIRRFAINSC
jgi:hypothetical protein